MEQAFLEKGDEYPVLGPHYFAARKAAEDFMSGFVVEQFEPLIKKASDAFYESMLENLQASLLSDVESNIQSTIWHQIDESVKALLSGQKWAMDRYALGERYNCDKIREAIAKHIPVELQDARLKDLEVEVTQLREENRRLREYR